MKAKNNRKEYQMTRNAMIAGCMVALIAACNQPTNSPFVQQVCSGAFIDTCMSRGIDEDTSYFSLCTVHGQDSLLTIECTGWGIEESGLLLLCGRTDSVYTARIGALCGTIPTRTWIKSTFTQTISRALEDSLAVIQMIYNEDTIKVEVKTTYILGKR
jgi:hypothetical protein